MIARNRATSAESPPTPRAAARRSSRSGPGLGALSVALALACAEPPLDVRKIDPSPREIASEPARPGPLPARPVATYRIDVSLDATSHRLAARQEISWKNTSSQPPDHLSFLPDPIAFPRRWPLLSPALEGGRSGGLVGREGKLEIESMRAPELSPDNLWRSARPAPGSPEGDLTDFVVPLPRPVEAGAELKLLIDFSAQLPEIVERTGYAGDFHLVAQWFPKLARLEPTGSFAHFPFHPYAEFYADFDDYEVEIDVPRGYEVASVGSIHQQSEDGDRVRFTATARRVVDFAFTAWPGAHVEERQMGGVLVRLLTPRGARHSRAAHWTTLERGLTQFSAAFGPYPYSTLTVVQPPRAAQRSGGMEYPTFITTGGSELGAFFGVRQTELLVIHELGHQWFQAVLASNEGAYPFLDEGLNSFAEWRYLEQNYGSGSLLGSRGLHVSRLAGGRMAAYFRHHPEVRVSQPAAAFRSFRELSQHVYARTPLLLLTLGRVFGMAKLDAALADYARRFAGKHPTPDDLYRTLALHLGEGQGQTIRHLFESPAGFGVSLGALDANRPARARPGQLESQLNIEISSPLPLPLPIRARFRDGTSRAWMADCSKPTQSMVFEHDSPLLSVSLDPERTLLIDEDFLDNRRFAEQPEHPWQSDLAITSLTQALLSVWAP